MRSLRGRDDGSAVVEFVTLGVLMLVPVVYLILTLGRIQAAAFAAEGAAREAGRVFVSSSDETSAAARVHAAVLLATRDQGFDEVDPAAAVDIECSAVPCLQPEARVAVRVEIEAVLPGVPAFVDDVVPTRVTVSAESVAVVDRFG